MAITPTYPGVYIQEIPSGVRTITGVATSITAFIGRAKRGPVNEPITINNYGDFERIFGGLWVDNSLSVAVRDFYLNGGSQAIIVRLFHDAGQAVANAAVAAAREANPNAASVKQAARTKADEYSDQPGESAANAVVKAAESANNDTPQKVVDAANGAVLPIRARLAVENANADRVLNLEAANEGAWGNSLRARVDYAVKDASDITLFNLTIRDNSTGRVEQFRNVSVNTAHARRVDKVLLNQSQLVRVQGSLPSERPAAHAAPLSGQDVWGDNSPATNSKVNDSGQANDGGLLVLDEFTGTGKEGAKEGLYALEKADLFNLLCIPPYLSSGDVDTSLITSAAQYCEKRRAMLLVDPPSNWNSKSIAKTKFTDSSTDYVGTRSKNAALFFPRLRQPNPLRGNQMENFAPCGVIAGVFARTDAQRGVWKAPAGLDATLVGVPELSVSLTDAENGELNPLGINCLRALPAAARVIWGTRTLQGDDRLASEWKYISVRRLALYIEESLYRGTQWVVFEPNDEPLWAQIRLNLGAFMHNLFRQGAFQGRSPKEAYFVKCDKETTTQNDRNLGIVNIVVGFAPLKPAEFVIISLQQMAGQVQM